MVRARLAPRDASPGERYLMWSWRLVLANRDRVAPIPRISSSGWAARISTLLFINFYLGSETVFIFFDIGKNQAELGGFQESLWVFWGIKHPNIVIGKRDIGLTGDLALVWLAALESNRFALLRFGDKVLVEELGNHKVENDPRHSSIDLSCIAGQA